MKPQEVASEERQQLACQGGGDCLLLALLFGPRDKASLHGNDSRKNGEHSVPHILENVGGRD
jgi:hypothetical protein